MGRHEGMQSFLGRRSSLSCSSMVASISWSPTLDKCLVQDTAPAKPALEMKPVTPNADALPCNTSGRLRLPHELRLSLDTPGSHKCLVQDTAPAKPALEIKPVTPNADALPCNTSGRLRLPHELRLSL